MAKSEPRGEAEGGSLGTRIETFLGEFRMIIPAMAAIFGFQLMLAFQQSFAELGRPEQAASFLAMACTAAAFLLLLMPASYHRFTWEFEETEEFLRFSRRSIGLGFVFMPMTLALTLYVQGVQVFGSRAVGAAIGTLTWGAAVGLWWVIPILRAREKGYLPHPDHPEGRRPRPHPPRRRRGGREGDARAQEREARDAR
jgi:hypothetical protein